MLDMTSLGVGSVAAITVICFLIGQLIKVSGIGNKWIPVICGLSGAALGVFGMGSIPNFPASDYFSAAAVGIVSGMAATGINQVYKQLGKEE